MRIIVAGCRSFKNFDLMRQALDDFIAVTDSSKVTIISGEAEGADALAKRYAVLRNLKCADFVAPWSKMGEAAGPFRNKLMADYALKDEDKKPVLFAFWNGISAGTNNMIDIAKYKHIETHIIYFNDLEEK